MGGFPYETVDMAQNISCSEGTRTLAKTNREGWTVLLMEAVQGGETVQWDHLAVSSTVERSAQHAVEAYTDKGGSRYVLEVSNPVDVAALKQITELAGGFKVRVGPHPSLNTVRCVISTADIAKVSEQTLKEHFATQGVVDVHRICKGNGKDKVSTTSVVLTCEGKTFPETVKFGLLRIRTRAYYELPLQCYNCYGYGHSRAKCKNKTRCRVCSGEHEIAAKCGRKAFCSNCRGNHQPTNRKCSTYVKEVGILRLKTDLGVPYRDAKKVYIKEKCGRTHAQVVVGGTSADTAKSQPASSFSKKPRKKKKGKAKKSVPQGKGSGGASASELASKETTGTNTGNKQTPKTKSTAVGSSPPAGVSRVEVLDMMAVGREGVVSPGAGGTDPLPDATTPVDAMELKLLRKQVDSLIKDVAKLKSRNRALTEAKTRVEFECAGYLGQLQRAGLVSESSEVDLTTGKPFTRKRKLDALEATKSGKNRKKGDDAETSPPVDDAASDPNKDPASEPT